MKKQETTRELKRAANPRVTPQFTGALADFMSGEGPIPKFDPGVLPPTEAEELAQLRAWKAEQMEVLSQLQLQECAKYLPVQLGESIPAAILPALKGAAEQKVFPAYSSDPVDLVGTSRLKAISGAGEAIKAAKRPQTSNIQIKMVVNGDLVTFDGSWLKELAL